jgi:hypothetical protein
MRTHPVSTPPRPVDLFAVQPRVRLADYASAEAFARRHRALAAQVHARRPRARDGAPLRPALAVWPALVGAPLALLGRPARLERVAGCAGAREALREALREAVGAVPGAEWPRVLGRTLRARPRSRAEAFHVTVAPLVHRVLWGTFSAIARDFGLWVVAGSAWLPENALGEGGEAFLARSARTYATSYTFSPEGRCVAVTRQVDLGPGHAEALGLSPGRAEALPVVDTPFGRLGTLLDQDGGGAACAAAPAGGLTAAALLLDGLDVDVVAHPAAHAWCPVGGDGSRGPAAPRPEAGGPAPAEGLFHVRHVVSAQLVGELPEGGRGAPSRILARQGGEGARGPLSVLSCAEDVREECVLHAAVDGAPPPAAHPALHPGARPARPGARGPQAERAGAQARG